VITLREVAMITTRTTLFSRMYVTAVWWISTTMKSKIAVSIGPTTRSDR